MTRIKSVWLKPMAWTPTAIKCGDNILTSTVANEEGVWCRAVFSWSNQSFRWERLI